MYVAYTSTINSKRYNKMKFSRCREKNYVANNPMFHKDTLRGC